MKPVHRARTLHRVALAVLGVLLGAATTVGVVVVWTDSSDNNPAGAGTATPSTTTNALPPVTALDREPTTPAVASAPDDRPPADADGITPEQAASPDWVVLEPGPFGARFPRVMTWTGEEIVFWRGGPMMESQPTAAAYSPATGTWRALPEGPLKNETEVGWIWTGTELVMWNGQGRAAAWNPDTNTWREMDNWPIGLSFRPMAVWAGEVVFDARSGQLVDPTTGETLDTADPAPSLHPRGSMVWTDGYAVSATSDGVFHFSDRTWSDMPESGLNPLAIAAASTGADVVAVDYEMQAASYNPDTNIWTPYSALPLRFFECSPRVVALRNTPVAELCSGIAIWSPDRYWVPLGFPVGDRQAHVVAAGNTLFAWDRTTLYRLKDTAIDNPRRLSVGISLLDLPARWTLTGTAGRPGGSRDAVLEIVDADREEACTVTAIRGGVEAILDSFTVEGTTTIDVDPIAGPGYRALLLSPGTLNDSAHVVWASGTSDVIDVACTTTPATLNIARATWTPP